MGELWGKTSGMDHLWEVNQMEGSVTPSALSGYWESGFNCLGQRDQASVIFLIPECI